MVKFAEVSRVTGKPESGKLSEDVVPKLRPAGSAPALSDQENGGVPPVAWMVCWYAVPTVPFATAEVVIVRGRAGVGIVGGAGGSWLAQPASQTNGIIPRIVMYTLSISFQVPLPSKISSRSIAKYFVYSIKSVGDDERFVNRRSDKSKTKLYMFKKKVTGLDATVTKRGTAESGSGSRRSRRQRESEREGRKSESHFPTSRIWTRNYPQERVGGAGSPSHY